MRTATRLGLAILALAAMVWAGDPWKEKPYQQWGQKDIAKILNDSPWAKMTTVSATWKPDLGAPEVRGMPGPAQQSEGGYGRGSATGAGMGVESSAPPAGGGSSQPSGPPPVAFEARWFSSRTIREALARLWTLDGSVPQADAERFVSQEPADYEVMVLGPDMTPFAQPDENSLKQGAYLTMKKSKLKLTATAVNLQRSRDGKKLTGVVFSFPKTVQNGEVTIQPDEKGIEFVCRAGSTTLRFTFDPQKMADPKGRDL